MTFKQAVYINGSTQQQGTVKEPNIGILIPNKLTLALLIAQADDAGKSAYGRLSLMDPTWKVMSSTSATVKWPDITPDSAAFKFRVAYKTSGDWAVFKLTAIKSTGPEPTITGWFLVLVITDYYGKVTHVAYPSMVLNAADVTITPPQ